MFIIAAIVIATTVLWIINSDASFNFSTIGSYGIIFFVVGFAIYIGIKRFGSIKRGEPAEDELSKKIMQKTAALSYYISLYLWLILMYLSDRLEVEAHTQIAAGILAMAVTFAVSWAIVNFMGMRHE